MVQEAVLLATVIHGTSCIVVDNSCIQMMYAARWMKGLQMLLDPLSYLQLTHSPGMSTLAYPKNILQSDGRNEACSLT